MRGWMLTFAIVAQLSTSNSMADESSSQVPISAASSSEQIWAKPTAVFLPPDAKSGGGSSSNSSSSSIRSKLAERFKTAIIPIPNEEDPKPTVNELKTAYASTIERYQRLGIGPEVPLMTHNMREKHEAKFAKPKKTYDEISIRFRFPDRTQVEYQLPATTQLPFLYQVLRSSLRESIPFTLYTSPPRQEYLESDPKLRGKKLSEMGWGRGAVVLVKWVGARPMSPSLLKQELLVAAQQLEPPSMGMNGQEDSSAASSAQRSHPNTRTLGGALAPSEKDKEKKMPEWLKGFKK